MGDGWSIAGGGWIARLQVGGGQWQVVIVRRWPTAGMQGMGMSSEIHTT